MGFYIIVSYGPGRGEIKEKEVPIGQSNFRNLNFLNVGS